jgi:hypothetical protein
MSEKGIWDRQYSITNILPTYYTNHPLQVDNNSYVSSEVTSFTLWLNCGCYEHCNVVFLSIASALGYISLQCTMCRYAVYNNWRYIHTKSSNVEHYTLQKKHVQPNITWGRCDRKDHHITLCCSILAWVHTWRWQVRPKHIVNEWMKVVFQWRNNQQLVAVRWQKPP